MKLSIIITCLDDPDLLNTLQSIHDTSGERCEVIIVSDGSQLVLPLTPVTKSVIVFQNVSRCGVGPSRTIGVHAATGEYVMLIDSHMRFNPGWYDEVIRRVEGRDKTIHCATCVGLDASNMNMNNPHGKYYGATFEIFGPDPNRGGSYRLLDAVWNKSAPEDDVELPCLMGACYVMPRKWFLHLDALRFLRSWGCDEQMLSLKSWLAGGDLRLMKNVEVGHIFATAGQTPVYKIPTGHVAYNKLFMWGTILPGVEISELNLISVYGGGELSTARKIIHENAYLLQTEIARNGSIFKHNFEWYADRHGIALNGKK